MGEILKAYQTLNKVLNLGLSREQMLAAEMQFKIDFAERVKFPKQLTKSANALSADWEFTAQLAPRRRALRSKTRKSLTQLKKDGLQQMQKRLGKSGTTARRVTRKRKKR